MILSFAFTDLGVLARLVGGASLTSSPSDDVETSVESTSLSASFLQAATYVQLSFQNISINSVYLESASSSKQIADLVDLGPASGSSNTRDPHHTSTNIVTKVSNAIATPTSTQTAITSKDTIAMNGE